MSETGFGKFVFVMSFSRRISGADKYVLFCGPMFVPALIIGSLHMTSSKT